MTDDSNRRIHSQAFAIFLQPMNLCIFEFRGIGFPCLMSINNGITIRHPGQTPCLATTGNVLRRVD